MSVLCICLITSFFSYSLYNDISFSNSIKNNFVSIYEGIKLRSQHQRLEIEYQKWVANGRKKVVNTAAIERVATLFNWDEKRALLSGWLKEI